MPRPERRLDPDAGPVEALAADLRKMRLRSGNPGYRDLAGRAGFSVATLANAAGGRRLPSLAVTLGFARACGEDPDWWERRWRQAAAASAGIRPAGADGAGEPAPYLGLAGYTSKDADRFFGRQDVVEQLMRMLRRQRFVAVFGASGSGKSSLLRAGLMPAFGRPEPEVADGCRGLVHLLTPGAEPLVALRRLPLPARPDVEILLVVDQFETLFTQCRDAVERATFVDDLAAMVDEPGGRTRVLISVRADFYAKCAELPVLVRLLAGANVPLGPLSEAQLREVISAPARQAGLSVERALLTKIVGEALGHPGALPLVSHALQETWRHRRGPVLTLAGYEESGGLTGAVAQTAESVYQRFDPGQQSTARQVLTRLVAVGVGMEDTARRAARVELDFPDVDVVLHELAAARLVVLDEDTVEIAHESLVGAWPRLYDWLHTDRVSLQLHRRLTEACELWDTHAQDPGALYRGVQLSAWDGRGLEQLTPLERQFLTASRDRHARAAAAGRRRMRLALIGLTAGMLALSVLVAWALTQTRRANDERDLALARQLVANAEAQLPRDPELGLLLARQAYDTRHIEEAQSVLRQAVVDSRIRAVVPASQGQVLGVAYSTDGRYIASGGGDGTVRVWGVDGSGTVAGSPRVLRALGGEVWSPVFSPDGRWLAAGGDGGTVLVWDLSTGAGPAVLRGHTAAVSGVAFSPDGAELASSALDGTVRIWDRAHQRVRRVLAVGGQTHAVAFSPDGRYLAASGDGPIWIWDAAGDGARRVFTGHSGSVWALRFSPDGHRLASAGADATVRVWNATRTDAPLILPGDDGTLDTVAFSPDGRSVAAGSTDSNTIHVWDTDGVDDPLVLHGHHGPVWSVAFSPDGRRLASGSADGTVRLWDPGYPGDPVVWQGHRAPVRGLALSRRGDRVASGGEDGTVHLWSNTGADLLDLYGHTDAVLAVALSADGRWIASGGRDRTVRIWDTTGRTPPTVLTGSVGPVHAVAFSPDAQRVASAGDDGTVRIWRRTDARSPLVLYGHAGPAFGLAFSPDGRLVASSGQDGTVRVWTVAGHAPPVVLRDTVPGLVWSVAFSPDGRRVASSGHDGTVRIWSSDGQGPPLILTGHQRLVWSVDFSPDGRTLASSGADGTLRIWRTDNGRELTTYRGQRSLTEQVRFTPDGQHLLTAHRDGTIRLWRCDACAPMDQIRALADKLAIRTLTPEERDLYLRPDTTGS